MADNKYGRIPYSLMTAPDLNWSAKGVYCALELVSFGSNTVAISERSLMVDTGLGRSTVQRMLKALVEREILKPVGKRNGVKVYRLMVPIEAARQAVAPKLSPAASKATKCSKCLRWVKAIGKAGVCRSCKYNDDLFDQVRQARAELGTSATAEQLAVHLKVRKLTKRIRDMLVKSGMTVIDGGKTA